MTDAPAATAAKAVAGALLRHAITVAGTALVAHGLVDQQTADSATGPIADYALGGGLAVGAASWAAIRARLTHSKWVQAIYAPARPLPGATPPASD